jgi:hypothetical protein
MHFDGSPDPVILISMFWNGQWIGELDSHNLSLVAEPRYAPPLACRASTSDDGSASIRDRFHREYVAESEHVETVGGFLRKRQRFQDFAPSGRRKSKMNGKDVCGVVIAAFWIDVVRGVYG